MSGKRICTAVLLAAGLALVACASTKIVDSWKAPGAGPQHFKKVLALAVVKNDGVRENAENAIRANIRGPEVVPSYKSGAGQARCLVGFRVQVIAPAAAN